MTYLQSLMKDLPMGADAKADLIDFIEGHSKDTHLSVEEYVVGGLLKDDAQMVLNDYAEGFCFTMEDVFMLTGR